MLFSLWTRLLLFTLNIPKACVVVFVSNQFPCCGCDEPCAFVIYLNVRSVFPYFGQFSSSQCLSHWYLSCPVGISALAECMDCPELKAAAEDFVQLHFTEVYKLDEFLQLDVTQLTHLLHQDKLTVRAEAQVHTRTHAHT